MKKRRRSIKRKTTTVVLDRFTHRELQEGIDRGNEAQALSDRVYFELERQRASRHDELCAALREYPGMTVDLEGWCRVLDWRWSQTPLSGAGSLKGIGGRFNIGEDLDRARGQAFRGLYLAQDVATAYAEYFGGDLSDPRGALTLGELALRRKTSFTTFLLSGQVEQILDLRTERPLVAFAAIIRTFTIASATRAALRIAKLQKRYAIQSTRDLHKTLLAPPSAWRFEPQAFGIPAPNQIFGRLVRDAGFEGILFPSQVGSNLNLVLYPDSFRGSPSRVKIAGAVPKGATHTVLDGLHF